MTQQRRPGKYPEVVRRQVVRLVLDHRGEYESEWTAITSIATKSGMTADGLSDLEWATLEYVDWFKH